MKQETQEIWQGICECAKAARQGFLEGARDEWRDQMRDGLKGLAYRFYVEPFVIVYRWVRLHVAKALGR